MIVREVSRCRSPNPIPIERIPSSESELIATEREWTKQEIGMIDVCGPCYCGAWQRGAELRWSSKNRPRHAQSTFVPGPRPGVYIRPRLDVILLIDIEGIRCAWNGDDGALLNGSNIGRLIWQQIKRGLAVDQAPFCACVAGPFEFQFPADDVTRHLAFLHWQFRQPVRTSDNAHSVPPFAETIAFVLSIDLRRFPVAIRHFVQPNKGDRCLWLYFSRLTS